jgi:hypothetical protein
MSNVLSPLLKQQFIGPTGAPYASGLLYSYEAGTSTPLATYNASGATNTNPVILDAAGRADVWIPTSTAYKFNLTDSGGNQVPGFPIDNVVSSQLITLYGGVDTGTINAYVLDFTSNFSALGDGIVIYWTPSNSNTGPSTLNVNDLGVISILNPNGAALQANQIIANEPAEVMSKGGKWLLLSSANLSVGSFTGTFSGFTGTVTGTVEYTQIGNLINLTIPIISGTSNATTLIMSGVPLALSPVTTKGHGFGAQGLDNGAIVSIGATVGSSQIIFTKDNGTNWTASGTKGLLNGVSFTYSLQ